MGRTQEIIVMDDKRRLGNGLCLPAGPLREPKSRLKTVDRIIINGKDMQIKPSHIYALHNQQAIKLDDLKNKTICAVAGIGNPERFFATLHEMGLTFQTKIFSDHHRYIPADLATIDVDVILMTEKDGVKCQTFAEARYYTLAVRAELTPADPR